MPRLPVCLLIWLLLLHADSGRARGILCNTNNPGCEKNQSTAWTSNRNALQSVHSYPSPRSLSQDWKGTLRERQSLHFFNAISAPELAGYADTAFWQQLLLQTTHLDDGIRHAVAAIGAIHERRLRVQAARINPQMTELLLFALRQCNKAISDLVKAPKNMLHGLLRSLTASILFACFESLGEDRNAARSHVIHATEMVRQAKKIMATKDLPLAATYPIGLDAVESLVAHYDSQTGHYFGDNIDEAGHFHIDFSQPVVINSISDARILLEQAISQIMNNITRLFGDFSHQGIQTMSNAKRTYRDWFRQWAITFEHYIDTTQLGLEASNVCKLLKAHQSTALICFSTECANGEETWASFTPDFEAALYLLLDVYNDSPRRNITSLPPQTPYFSSTMGMTEPLFVISTRCVDQEIAAKARALMKKLSPSEGLNSSWKADLVESFLCGCTGKRSRTVPVNDLVSVER